ncbi:hypothetical protein [Campylobacter sp. 19-13652]|uniref:hypothetical protein n=1 Tax=Campylobacter sp. 19-13652 TaxID=2840180 RepID=UPI001C77C815|nr:hypothetical protein [Campylobacter sp. 19-13652]BCX78629.1 hypothetical protein LBC_00910 [Campylobacter sp. 19-13652]BCX79145.1 hypothetical protein LBC_06070 [Campylobacter sp. 19-13652]
MSLVWLCLAVLKKPKLLQGEYAIYERKQTEGSDVESEFYHTTITGKSQIGLLHYLLRLAKARMRL